MEPENEFNLFEFQKRFYEIFNSLLETKKLPVLVGGTGLYLESVLVGYDMPQAVIDEEFRKNLSRKSKDELQNILYSLKPELHNKTDLEDSGRLIRAIEIEMARSIKNSDLQKKPDIDAVVFGVRWERTELRQRITARLEERLQEGMMEEVVNLHSSGLSWAKLESFGLEYRFLAQYLQKMITFDEMKDKLNIAIHQFAKRQETWFRRMERKGIMINWIQGDNYSLLKESAIKFLR
jgi:tRNA dimethylallyltransferase